VRKALKLRDAEQARIGDFTGPDPVDGYGPYRVFEMRGKADPTDHADSFRCLATHAYWHEVCRPGLEQYGPGKEGEPMCDTEGREDLGRECHPV
jgi:hypothetical protein